MTMLYDVQTVPTFIMLYDMFERFAPGFTRKLDTMHYYYYQGNEYKQSQIKQKFYK